MNMMIEANISNSEIASCATATATMTHTAPAEMSSAASCLR